MGEQDDQTQEREEREQAHLTILSALAKPVPGGEMLGPEHEGQEDGDQRDKHAAGKHAHARSVREGRGLRAEDEVKAIHCSLCDDLTPVAVVAVESHVSDARRGAPGLLRG